MEEICPVTRCWKIIRWFICHTTDRSERLRCSSGFGSWRPDEPVGWKENIFVNSRKPSYPNTDHLYHFTDGSSVRRLPCPVLYISSTSISLFSNIRSISRGGVALSPAEQSSSSIVFQERHSISFPHSNRHTLITCAWSLNPACFKKSIARWVERMSRGRAWSWSQGRMRYWGALWVTVEHSLPSRPSSPCPCLLFVLPSPLPPSIKNSVYPFILIEPD